MIKTLLKVDYNKKLIRILLEAKAGAIAVNAIGPFFYFFIFYGTIPLNILIGWTSLQLFLFTIRIKVGINLFDSLDTKDDKYINNMLKVYLFCIFMNSLLWGIATIFTLQYGNQDQVFIIMAIVFGMLTGSMSTLTPILHAVMIFVLNIVIFFMFSLVFIGASETYYFIAFFLFVYLIVTIPAAYRIHISMSNSIIQNEEIELLNKQLEQRVYDAIEETKQKEKLLQQQSRLAQMGEMISMIAHQWRQPLGAISTTAIGIETKLMLNKFNLSEENGRDKFKEFLSIKLKDINGFVQSLSTTIDDFRNFFKPDKDKEIVSLNEPINRALKIVKTSMSSKGIVIKTSLNNNERLLIYQNEVMQVILNILKNSEDNFIDVVQKNPQINITTKKVNNNHIIKISDNGGGIPDDILPDIFNPYFSTKDEKNGTGLGLYMSKIMIEDHHSGKLEVVNIDDGVEFKIILKGIEED